MSLQPAHYKFTIWRGATFSKRITYLLGDQNSDPQDLTGYTALLEIKDAPEGTVIFTLSTTNGRIVLGSVSGTIDLTISAADTAAITWVNGVYDLVLTSGSGVTDPILFGGFSVRGV